MGTVTELRTPVLWGEREISRQLLELEAPGALVGDGERIGVAPDARRVPGGLRTLCTYPALSPSQLGSPAFRADHQVRYAYKTGAMANAIASADLVIAMAKAGLLASYGAGGVPVPKAEADIARIRSEVGDAPFAVNLIHAPHEQAMEEGLIDVLLRHRVHRIEASAFMNIQKSVVRYRAAGLSEGADGAVIAANKVIAKVSHPVVAEGFMRPAPAPMLEALLAEGRINRTQHDLALRIPVADDITAEADSGGHTDRRPLGALLPILLRLRDRIAREEPAAGRIRIGAGGGIGSPTSLAGALSMGADYVVTGSVNQACIESGSSQIVRGMLAKAGLSDCTMAPAADMFEMGVELQVLKRGTMFPARARQLYDLYRKYDSLEAIPADIRTALETKLYKRPLSQVWNETVAYFGERDPGQIERAKNDPKRRMALVFRAYLGQASHWANAGLADRRTDYQIWTGPAIGDFNDWTADSYLSESAARKVVDVAEHLMRGAALELRLQWLALAGVRLPVRPHYRIMPL